MNTAERNLDKDYKEWCKKNQDFLKRYVSEFLDEKKDNIEKVINDHIEAEIKKYLSHMSQEEWDRYLGMNIAQLTKYYLDSLIPKVLEDLIFADRNQGRAIPDYNHPRYRGYSTF